VRLLVLTLGFVGGIVAFAATQLYCDYENQTTALTLKNPTGGNATLYAGKDLGNDSFGKRQFNYEMLCEAAPHTSCEASVFSHRHLFVYARTQYIFLGSLNSNPVVVDNMPTENHVIIAEHSTEDTHYAP